MESPSLPFQYYTMLKKQQPAITERAEIRLFTLPSFLLEIPLIHVYLPLFPGPGKEANVHHAHLVHSTVPVGYFHCLRMWES